MSNFALALVVGLVAGLAEWDGFGFLHSQLSRPLMCGTLMGLVLGDIKTGMYVGASLQFVFLGSFGVGASLPPDATSGTCIATALCIIAKLDPDVAVSLAIPVASFTLILQMFIWTFNSTLMHAADRAAEVGDADRAGRWNLVGSFLFFVQGFVPAFLAVQFGAPYVASLVDIMPEWILGWLSLAGSMLPAVGFGMLFIMMNRPKLTPFFIIGIVLAASFGGTLISTGLIGLAAALLYVLTMDKFSSGERKTRRMADEG